MRIRFGWSLVFSALIFLAGLKLAAQEKAAIRVPHIDHPPQLEDFLGGEANQSGLRITDFRQRKPRDGAPASQATTAYLSYDDHNFYVAFICVADPRTLRAHM